ncbi:MAG: LysR family transcriptional regulator [Bdellovibrionaceae bacterium]|nr:LysR family transcriptional regulator [Pseudobdellovibrionaceae bacterium]
MRIEDLNLSALKYFLDAVQLNSITLSAEKNHVSRPAVSQAILRLEQWSGKTLLVHEKRRFGLTEDGRTFYELARLSFDNLKEGFSRQTVQDQSLKIGCSASLIDLVFPKIQRLLGKSPLPIVKIGSTSRLIELLEQKQIHLAFLIPTYKISGCKTVDFHSGKFVLRSKSGQMDGPLIVTERRPETEDFERFAAKKRLRIGQRIEVESWTVASRLAKQMDGTCLVPDYISDDSLRTVSPRGWTFPYKAQVAVKQGSFLSSLESELLQSLW